MLEKVRIIRYNNPMKQKCFRWESIVKSCAEVGQGKSYPMVVIHHAAAAGKAAVRLGDVMIPNPVKAGSFTEIPFSRLVSRLTTSIKLLGGVAIAAPSLISAPVRTLSEHPSQKRFFRPQNW